MKRTPLTRGQPIRRTGRVKPVNRKRKQSEFARCYHSKERVAWVKAQPCVVCGDTPSENAHTENGGMGRKGGYQTIVPLCRTHHRQQHQHGWEGLRVKGCGFDLSLGVVRAGEALLTQLDWERYAAED